MAIKKILVTGSSGMLGTRLCEKLLEKNYHIVGVDLKPNKWSKTVDKLTIIKDLRNEQAITRIKDIDMVIHLAANARVYELVKNPALAKDNFTTLFNTLEFCRKKKVKRFIFTSSREVYGNSKRITRSEKEPWLKSCKSPYTASKLAGEAMVYAYHQCYGLNFIIVRFSNVYGMYDDSDRVIPLWIKLSKEGKDLTVYGQDKLLDFTYIDDAMTGILKCMENFESNKNEVFNIASGKGTPLIKVARLIQKYTNSKNKIILKENRTGEIVKFIANITKAKEKLNYQPKTSITKGIKKSISWYTEELYKNF